MKDQVIFRGMLKGKLDMDGEIIFIGDTDIKTIIPDHFDKNIFEVVVKVYEHKEVSDGK